MNEDLASYLAGLRQFLEAGLVRALPADAPLLINDAMRYALMGGGKRLRPCLALAVAEAVSTSADGERARWLALPGACAVELIHSYSLVHDDLPAMDDDALRRGRPTTHVVYGEGMAVLAGDGLLTEAFGLLAAERSCVLPDEAPVAPVDRRVRAIHVLAKAAGAVGMVGGQAIDLAAAGQVKGQQADTMSRDALRDMHARKTGALIRAACTIGAILAGADDAVIAAVDGYATEMGLAFQIVDDVLDVEGSAADLGKTAGKDAAAGKPTYPSIYGLEESKRLAAACVASAKQRLPAARVGGRLADIADWSLTRRA